MGESPISSHKIRAVATPATIRTPAALTSLGLLSIPPMNMNATRAMKTDRSMLGYMGSLDTLSPALCNVKAEQTCALSYRARWDNRQTCVRRVRVCDSRGESKSCIVKWGSS